MLRSNLKTAIIKSGLYVKEIAAESGVKKKTIDKWVGVIETEPKVNDLYKVCVVLKTTMEEIVDGESGMEYVRKIIRNDPTAIQVPDRIRPVVDDIVLLDDNDLIGIRANIKAIAETKRKDIR
jgi:transcriptional regulator with XRE-family HTH domain